MRVTVGVVGVGRWGPNLLRNFHNQRTSVVVAVADQDEARRRKIAELYPDVAVTEDAAAVIEDSGVEAVVIATPTRTHHTLARQALLAGKHMLVEKPLTDNLASAVEVARLAEERGRVLLVGHTFLFNAGVLAVKQFLDEGRLGRPYYISMIRTNLGPIRTDVSAAWDLAAHDVSIANYWLDAPPVSASAHGGTWINPGIRDAVFATLEYPDNTLVNLEVSWLNPRKVRYVTVVAEHRMLTLDDTNETEPVRIYDKGVADDRVRDEVIDTFGEYRSMVHEGEIVIPRIPPSEPLRAECDHFIECVTGRAEPRTGPAVAIDVVRVLQAIDQSMRCHGARVPLVPA